LVVTCTSLLDQQPRRAIAIGGRSCPVAPKRIGHRSRRPRSRPPASRGRRPSPLISQGVVAEGHRRCCPPMSSTALLVENEACWPRWPVRSIFSIFVKRLLLTPERSMVPPIVSRLTVSMPEPPSRSSGSAPADHDAVVAGAGLEAVGAGRLPIRGVVALAADEGLGRRGADEGIGRRPCRQTPTPARGNPGRRSRCSSPASILALPDASPTGGPDNLGRRSRRPLRSPADDTDQPDRFAGIGAEDAKALGGPSAPPGRCRQKPEA